MHCRHITDGVLQQLYGVCAIGVNAFVSQHLLSVHVKTQVADSLSRRVHHNNIGSIIHRALFASSVTISHVGLVADADSLANIEDFLLVFAHKHQHAQVINIRYIQVVDTLRHHIGIFLGEKRTRHRVMNRIAPLAGEQVTQYVIVTVLAVHYILRIVR